MEIALTDIEKKDQRIAQWTSLIVHSLLILILFLPLLKFPIPPPGQEGILVSFGVSDQGQGDDKPMTQNEEKVVDPSPPAEPSPPQPDKPKVSEEPKKPKEAKAPKAPDPKVITTEDPETAALKKKQKEDALKAAEETKAQKAAEAETRKQAAAEEARKKAEADAAAKEKADLENAKKQFGEVFGSGKGNTGKPGNQGDPNGDPNADNLKGISTGSGKVGGGLDGRGVKFEPKVLDQSQKTGRVVLNVCVDASGNVLSAKYTQKGSTTTDATLRQIAEDSAKKFKFTSSSVDQQCGTITYDFIVK